MVPFCWSQPKGPNFFTAALTTPQTVSSSRTLVELKMLDISDRTGTGVIMTLAAEHGLSPKYLLPMANYF